MLALGTIGTTKILLQHFNLYEQKIRLKHNPQLAIIGFLRKKIANHKKTISGDLFFNVRNDNELLASAGSLGTISDDIIDVICKKFVFIPSSLIKIFFKIFKNNQFSNSYLSLKKDGLSINGGYKADYYNFEKNIIKTVRQNFSNFSLFSYFYRMPVGSDIHYTGTMDKKNHQYFEINKNYSLKKDNNIYVIDGSILHGNPIYPGFYIINNAIDFSHKFT